MKKYMFFVGVLGLLSVSGANAAGDSIKAASTNTVLKDVYDIQYGAAGDTTSYSYRKGVNPQKNELNTAIGGEVSTTLANVTVGNLAATGDNATHAAVSNSVHPTQTIRGNTANVAVLERDKLVRPGNGGNCSSGKCGYVTVGGHTNTTTDKVWLTIQ